MTRELVAVITTIQAPTASVRRFAARMSEVGAWTIVVADKKGPDHYDVPGARLLTLAEQLELPFDLARLLPTGHYARKNVGYLLAIADGVGCVYETDDDNHPTASWTPRSLQVQASRVEAAGWYNAYAPFTRELIWPRGLPLDAIRGRAAPTPAPPAPTESPIQQGLADGSPDVDAIWRLVLDRDVRFSPGPSLELRPGTWCPFNSQSTWWWPAAYRLMYLPSHCSFRMTDIWRSFVAQRCLWELGHGVVFHAAEVEQLRNAHDLTRDFEQEIPGYRGNSRIAELLERLPLGAGSARVGDNFLRCWEALVAAGFVPEAELALACAWSADVDRLIA